MPKTIWMNVTLTNKWNRPHVGISRVESELRNKLKKIYKNHNLKECIFLDNKFFEIANYQKESELSKKNLSNDKNVIEKSVNKRIYLFDVISRKQSVKNILQSIFSLTPDFIKPLTNLLIKILIKFYNFLKKYKIIKIKKDYHLIETSSLNIQNKTFQHPFNSEDIFFSCGLDWEYDYSKKFYDLRVKDQIKVITIVYDLIPIKYPNFMSFNSADVFERYFDDLILGSTNILCISENTKKDLENYILETGARTPKLDVIRLGNNILNSNKNEKISEMVNSLCSDNFILYVSTIENRKNHQILCQAYNILCEQGKKNILPKLIFVGMHGWGVSDLLKTISLNPSTKDLIIVLNEVNDSELLKLYEKALFCVYPSFYEGWGLPIAEALSLNKVVVSSNTSSLPEVGKDLVIYADPYSPREWANIIYDLLKNPEKIKILEDKIKKNYISTTWEKTSKDLKTIIDRYV
jgi:glycosyltransferase involved in cell wall biosynthesis